DRGSQLVAGHLLPGLRRPGAMAPGDEELDDLGALLNLVAHALAEAVGAVADVHGAEPRHTPVPGDRVVAVASGAQLAAARLEPGPGDETILDGRLDTGLDLVRAAGAHDRRVAGLKG